MTTLLFQLRAELWKLFARKRSYMGFVAFALLQVALWLVIKLMKGEDALKRQVALQGEAVGMSADSLKPSCGWWGDFRLVSC